MSYIQKKNSINAFLQYVCLAFFLTTTISVGEEGFYGSADQNPDKTHTIIKELEVISSQVSELQNLFIYHNQDKLSQTQKLDLLQRIDKLENKLSSAIDFLENLENKVDKVSKLLVLKVSEISEEVDELQGGEVFTNQSVELYGQILPEKFYANQKTNELLEDQKEYLSIKTIFENGNYALAVEEFTSFLERFDESKLKLQAKFWRAESNLRLNNWTESAGDFLDVFSSDPNGPISLYALFGIVLNFSELGQYNQSCAALFEIKSRDEEEFEKFQGQLESFGKNLNCDLGE